MRKLRENLPNRVCHLISRGYPPAVRLLAQRGAMRGAHRAFFLNAEERTRFVEMLRRVAAFSGVELLAYCVMTNHVHILVFVPDPEKLSDDEVLSRMRILYRDSRFAELRREWDERLKLGRTAAFLRFRGTFTRRMWNASEFMKTLKQHFTMSYNGRRTHAGTMWEGRYHVRVHKPDSLGEAGAVMMTAAYIDLNPVKAGIVSGIDALADYEWGSYHDACAGDRGAIAGYDLVYRGRGRPWRELKAFHRISLNMAAKDLAARDAEEEGLTPKSVPTLRRERKDALRFSRAELKEPERVPVLIESGNNQLAHNLLKLIAKNGPMRPVELRDALGIASRAYFTLKYLSPLAAGGYIAPVGKGSPSSSRRAYKLTRRGEEAAQ